MDTSKIIKGVVNSGRYTVTAPIIKEDYGLYLQIEGVELPQTYEVDFSNSEHNGTSVTMIGNSDGVLIPHQFIDTGKDIFAFLYHVGEDFGRTVYKFRIPNKVRPDRTSEQPTPEEQSTIDQCISALNTAVAQTAQDVIDADASAQSAQGYTESAEGYAESASTSASNALASETNAERYADRAETAESHAQDYASQASGSESSADDSAETAEAYATGKRDGVDVGSSDPTYHNNSKYYSEQASASATTASTKAGEASESASTASSKATEASGYASTASTKAGEASTSAQTATQKATEATTAAGTATTAKNDAVAAKIAAETAQGKAEDAQAAAESVAESIPSDYSQLSEDVSDLKEDLSVMDTTLELTRKAPESVANNYGLLSTGYAKYNTSCCVLKYPVTEGDTILIKSPTPAVSNYASFQFQSAAGASESSNVNLVGTPYTTKTHGYIVVPAGATYVLISTLKTDTESGLYNYDVLDDIDIKIEGLHDDIDDINARFKQCYIAKESTGNPIILVDSSTEKLISLTADADCTVTISGKNLLSPDFNKVTWENKEDETVIYGKGAYDYVYPSRVTVEKCADNTITLIPTTANYSSTGVGIFVKVKPNTKYVLSYNVSGSGTASVSLYDANKSYITSKENAASGFSFTTGSTVEYACAVFRGTSQNNSVTFTNMQLEEDGTPSEFTRYQTKQIVSATGGTVNVESIYSYYPATYIEGTNDATLTVKYYANVGSVLDQSNEVLIEDIQKNAFVSAYNILDGWEDHAKAFAAMMMDATYSEGFMFFTDTHFMAKRNDDWKKYAYSIFAYLEQLYYASPCSFVLHGGDWLGSGEARADFLYKLSTLGGVFRSKFNRFALLVGNHETGNQSAEGTVFTHDTLATTLLSNVGKTYYVFDANTFRMYCFDSWASGALDSYANEQIAWFANSLLTESAKHIVIAIHILYNEGTLKPLGDELTKCAAAYNSRGTYSYNGTTYDFSSVTSDGKVGFVIAGHEHRDTTGTVNGIPYIMTINTTSYSDTSFANLPLPVDLIKVDWHNGTLTAYRAARGSAGTTRTLTIIT